ncbi:hypothetical protein HDU81_005231 [Chytriomyces hyalinus]|nr:hypothetical protein HDU81_005231 [Chytriomyces hyalinus]
MTQVEIRALDGVVRVPIDVLKKLPLFLDMDAEPWKQTSVFELPFVDKKVLNTIIRLLNVKHDCEFNRHLHFVDINDIKKCLQAADFLMVDSVVDILLRILLFTDTRAKQSAAYMSNQEEVTQCLSGLSLQPKRQRKPKAPGDTTAGRKRKSAAGETTPATASKKKTVEESATNVFLVELRSMTGIRETPSGDAYFQMLQAFKEGGYPTETDVCCWWCTEPFQSAPIGIPKKRDEETGVFHVVGCFCSWNCAVAFNQDSLSGSLDSNAKGAHELLLEMYRQTNDFTESTYPTHIRPAPSRYVLAKLAVNWEFPHIAHHLP